MSILGAPSFHATFRIFMSVPEKRQGEKKEKKNSDSERDYVQDCCVDDCHFIYPLFYIYRYSPKLMMSWCDANFGCHLDIPWKRERASTEVLPQPLLVCGVVFLLIHVGGQYHASGGGPELFQRDNQMSACQQASKKCPPKVCSSVPGFLQPMGLQSTLFLSRLLLAMVCISAAESRLDCLAYPLPLPFPSTQIYYCMKTINTNSGTNFMF